MNPFRSYFPRNTLGSVAHLTQCLRVSVLTCVLLLAGQISFGADEPARININTATAATLAEVLKGIGDAKAEAIVAYRETHGPFVSIEQLDDVKGIGEATLAANRHLLTVE